MAANVAPVRDHAAPGSPPRSPIPDAPAITTTRAILAANDLSRRCDEAASRLRRVLRGEVSTSGRVLTAFSSDAGRIVRRRPAIVVSSTCEHDVSATLATARELEIPVSVRGRGHSVNGQVLSDGGIVLADGPEGGDVAVHLGDGLFEISARARWIHVERELNRLDWTIPVLADYLGLSVGGTVSVGCYGERSIIGGGLVDHVRRLRLVLPDGTARWCSRDDGGELFRFSLAGLGQLGVIERLVVQAVPLRRAALEHTYRHRSFGDLIDSIEWMTGQHDAWPDTFGGTRFQILAGRRWDIRCTFGALSRTLRDARRTPPVVPSNLGSPARRELYRSLFASRSRNVALWTALEWRQSRVWTDYILDFDGARRFVALIEEQYRDGAYEGCATSLYVVAVRRPPGALDLPLAPANHTDGSMRLGIGVFSFVPRGDDARLARVRRTAARCLEACIDLGGRPYLYGWCELNAASARRVYGDSLDQLRQLRAELDPGGLFQRGKIPGV